jgi:hypothetical protein
MAHLPHVSPVSGPATRAGIRPVMPGHPAEEPGSQPRVSRCLSAAGIRFLGILFPPAGFRPPHGRPTRQCLDPGGVSTLRTSESRPDWVPSLPRGPAVLTRPVRSLRPPLAPSSRGQALSPRRAFHLPELSITRRHRGFTRVHPPGLPPRLLTLDGTGPLGLAPRASHPGRQDPHGARQGRGRASSTRPELYARHQHRTSVR